MRQSTIDKIRILLVGTAGIYAHMALYRLLDASARVVAVAVAGPAPPKHPDFQTLPVEIHPRRETIITLAQAANVPTVYVENPRDPEALSELAVYRPDLIFVACAPYVLPDAFLKLPSIACLNLHPSLLPAYRGPTPLFWQFRAGESQLGVTLHMLTEHLDAGPIVGQVRQTLPDGISGPDADALLADLGAQLFLDLLGPFRGGKVASRPQNESVASYFRAPTEDDFRVSPNWCAQRAFNFMRGTAHWGYPYSLTVERACFKLKTARSYSPDAELGKRFLVRDDRMHIQFSPGVLDATLA